MDGARAPEINARPSIRMHTFPHDADILTTPAEEVTVVDHRFMDLAREVEMLAIKHQGYAVAATQAGIPLRFFVFQEYYARKFGFPSRLIVNPLIAESSGNLRMEESCLSLPEFKAWLDRPEQVTVRYRTLERPNEETFTKVNGIAARVVQHEIDHLDGKMFHEMLDATYSDKVKRYLTKRRSRG